MKIGIETLFLAVFIVDKFSSKKQVQRDKYQLLAITALFVAAKYEQIVTPRLKDYGGIVRGDHWNFQILDMESQILLTLSFQLGVMTSIKYMKECLKKLNAGEKTSQLSQYLLELTLLEFDLCMMNPLVLSLGVVAAAGQCLGVQDIDWVGRVSGSFELNSQQVLKMVVKVKKVIKQRSNVRYK